VTAETASANSSLCECGGAFTPHADAATACSADDDLTADAELVIENWLGYAKIDATNGGEIPGMLSDDLAKFKTADAGVWETVSCFADAEATVISQCGTDYDILRALWDSSDIDDAALLAGGLDAATLGDVLYEYELLSQAADFAGVAAAFEHGIVDDADAVWDTDLQTALNALFCNASGALNTKDQTVEAAAAFAEVVGDFYQEDFDAFITATELDITATTDELATALSATATNDYLWLDSICSKATIA